MTETTISQLSLERDKQTVRSLLNEARQGAIRGYGMPSHTALALAESACRLADRLDEHAATMQAFPHGE